MIVCIALLLLVSPDVRHGNGHRSTGGLGKILLPHIPSAGPADPALLIRASSQTNQKGQADEGDAQTPTGNPTSSLIQLRARTRPRQLAREREQHEGRVDPVPGVGLDRRYRGTVRHLGDLQTHIEGEGLDDGTGDGVFARVRAHNDAREVRDQTEQTTEHRGEGLDEEFGVKGAQTYAGDADQAEQADDDGAVVVRGIGQEEGQGGPVAREAGGDAVGDQAGLDQDGVFAVEQDDAADHFEVVQPVRVGGWVVRHEQPERDEDAVLQGQGDPVDVAPGRVVGHDAREDARDHDA